MKLFKSIKWKLLIWQTVLLAGVLLTLMTLHYQFQKRDLIAEVDAELQEHLMAVMPMIAPPKLQAAPLREINRRPSRQPRLNQRGLEQTADEILTELGQRNIYLIFLGPDGIKQYGQVPSSLIEQMPKPPSEPVKITRDGNRERIHPHHNSLVIIGQPLTAVNAEMAALLGRLILIGVAVLLTGFGIGWLIITRALRPIRTISSTAETIASGAHHERIELADAPDELSSLARTLNSSFDHMDEAIETQKRFSADASHELRTPISVVIAQAEAALKRDRTTEEYQGVLNACLRAGKRMKNMAESLLDLTRLDSASTALQKTECDLNEVIADAVDSASLLSEQHPVHFQCLEKQVSVTIDRDRIHQVITNLIANAVQHNPDGCKIDISLTKEGIIKISDNGVGIPPESLPHIFDRFYRVDQSRSRELGGAGLGLSIVQRLVEAHGGQITVTSEPDLHTTFTIRLPVA